MVGSPSGVSTMVRKIPLPLNARLSMSAMVMAATHCRTRPVRVMETVFITALRKVVSARR